MERGISHHTSIAMRAGDALPVILAFAPYYLPGYRAGGPIRALCNLVEELGDEFQFRIVTQDHDLGIAESYPGVQAHAWSPVGKALVYYASSREITIRRLARLVAETQPDVLYLNSFFDPIFTLRLLLLRSRSLIPAYPCIVAPRGELADSALSLKRLKKRIYMSVARTLGLYDRVCWQATSQLEMDAIVGKASRVGGEATRIALAPDLLPRGPRGVAEAPPSPPAKRSGRLKTVFLSRIARMKNLDFAVRMIAAAEGELSLDIYGTVEDKAYWRDCLSEIQRAAHVAIAYRGEVPHHEVAGVLAQAELLVLPTRGENFGFAIVEALGAGCPVLISDRTPWRGLRAHRAGWDCSLEDEKSFVDALAQCTAMDEAEFRTWREGARAFAAAATATAPSVVLHRQMFHQAMGTEAQRMSSS